MSPKKLRDDDGDNMKNCDLIDNDFPMTKIDPAAQHTPLNSSELRVSETTAQGSKPSKLPSAQSSSSLCLNNLSNLSDKVTM